MTKKTTDKKKMQTAPCRFCHQMVSFETDGGEFTPEQAEERATMECNCSEARDYQKEARRKERAMKNVEKMFGADAKPGKRASEEIVDLLKHAVEEIYTGELAKITLNLRGGIKASASQNAKGEINIERTETKKEKMTE